MPTVFWVASAVEPREDRITPRMRAAFKGWDLRPANDNINATLNNANVIHPSPAVP